MKLGSRFAVAVSLLLALGTCGVTIAQTNSVKGMPWMNTRLSPDERADLVIQQMTLDEKIQLLHGSQPKAMFSGGPDLNAQTRGALGGDGFVPGIPRLGIPDLQLIGAGVGVTDLGKRKDAQSTALPSALAETATWNLDMARKFGKVIGTETRDQGFNVSLGGGIDLTREPRDGRTFEYHGEDPLLAGEMTGAELKAIQAQGVIATIKHYAVNDQETGRYVVSSDISRRAMRETDLLAFEIAIERSDVGTVMCSYNRVNDVYACQNKYLLTDVLKRDWGFPGWVMSDWGATHSTVASALAGLDQEFYENKYFGAPLKAAVLKGKVPMSRLNDMDHRILRTMFAVGVIDHPPVISPVDFKAGEAVAQRVEEEGCVLLKNSGHLLPLNAASVHSIAVIGSHANLGVLSGGGSAQVEPHGGNAILLRAPTWTSPVWDPSPPLLAILAKASRANVFYNDGKNVATAAQLAGKVDVAIVFVHQFTHEDADLPTLKLPDHQDKLVRQVALANPRTIVVAETGTAFLMPWLDHVAAVLEAWYPGIRGGEAIANILFGDVNPSGKLPITFPKSDADLPHPVILHPPHLSDKKHPAFFDVHYTEGLQVGYKWYDEQKIAPLFPFGFGLSYTTFSFSNLHVASGKNTSVTFDVKNTGHRAGAEVAQVYLGLPSVTGEPPKRLAGWRRVRLGPEETRSVTITLPPRMMAIFDVKHDDWQIPRGTYQIFVGSSSRQVPLRSTFSVQDTQAVQ